MALAKQQILLNIYKTNLMSWRGSVVNQYSSARKSLLIRVGLLVIVVGFLIGLSESFRRLTLRHVHDPSRRNVIIVVQRILLWSVIGLVLAFAFATDLSSMATFIGLLTAGVAVALQNVILAVLGYFVLVGKLGLRVGDLIQISGVTGEVIDIGLMQFQVREVNADRPGDQHADRVVSFSNSFVFLSPATGLFKWVGETRSVDAASAGR
jgi:small-conductance mechanosensitive channel